MRCVVRARAWSEVPVEEVAVNDELLVKAGELFPVDGTVIEGGTSADESALTGESLPVSKRLGDSVAGGTLSIDGRCVIRVSRPLEQSALTRIVALIEGAQQQKAPAQRFTDSFSRYYTWVALSLGAGASRHCFLHHAPGAAFYRAMTVLVVASPCALYSPFPQPSWWRSLSPHATEYCFAAASRSKIWQASRSLRSTRPAP